MASVPRRSQRTRVLNGESGPRPPLDVDWDLDGELEATLRRSKRLRSILNVVAANSHWVSERIVRSVDGAVYPRTRRTRGRQEKRGDVVEGGVVLWDNQPAVHAFWTAYGVPVPSRSRPTWIKHACVCHIYGDQDSARDPAHFTHLANLIAVPGSLESLTEWGPVRAALKWQSYRTYGYTGPGNRAPAEPGPDFPSEWPGMKGSHSKAEEKRILGTLLNLRRYHPDYHTPRRAAR